MVFVGTTSSLMHDIHPTPIGMMPGVILTANETLTLSTGKFLHCAGRLLNFAIILIFVFVSIVSWASLPVMRGIVVNLIGIVIFPTLGFLLFLRGIIIDPFGGAFLIASISIILYGKKYIILALENIEMRRQSVTDGLTGMYNYRYFELQIKRELETAAAEKKPLSLVIYDIDHFKKLNDTYGHEFGNAVLIATAKIIKNNTRKHDTATRYGGDEFCVLMPEVDSKSAKKCVERVLGSIKLMALNSTDGKNAIAGITITMSAGIASLENCSPEKPADFIMAADSALYMSKEAGRGKVSVFIEK